MSEFSAIADEVHLPSAPRGWFDYGYAPLADGRLALVRARIDFHAERLRWWQEVSGGNRTIREPGFCDDDIRLSVFDGASETDVVIVPSGTYPTVDRTLDGRWVVASSRAHQGEKNGRIYAPDGREEHAMILGDAIETLLCSPDGTLWVGYFDEGVFGGPNKDGSWPVSSGGIVQFDAFGKVLWSFNAQSPNEHYVDDVYAMTLSDSTLWACFYTDFPIASVDKGKIAFWSNSVGGAKAIAVEDDVVLLAGGYTKDAGRIAVVKLESATSHQRGRISFEPTTLGSAGLLQGRGSILHIINKGLWSKVSVRRAAEHISLRGVS